MIEKLGLGGGCHWYTEGIFNSLIGVKNVKQGWIASDGKNSTFSEGIVLSFIPEIISLEGLIEIHLYTHASTSNHSMRHKYRSAIYTFSKQQQIECETILKHLQLQFEKKIITQILPYKMFKENIEEQLNYFYSKPNSAFCSTYIHPKLKLLINRFSAQVDQSKMAELRRKNIEL